MQRNREDTLGYLLRWLSQSCRMFGDLQVFENHASHLYLCATNITRFMVHIARCSDSPLGHAQKIQLATEIWAIIDCSPGYLMEAPADRDASIIRGDNTHEAQMLLATALAIITEELSFDQEMRLNFKVRKCRK
jgi:hypothetical protein